MLMKLAKLISIQHSFVCATSSVSSCPALSPRRLYCAEAVKVNSDDGDEPTRKEIVRVEKSRTYYRGKEYKPVDLNTSIQYVQSEAFKESYKNLPVWHFYRRNFKGHFAPVKTRKSCIFDNKLMSANPCPVCRDEYLVLDFRNVELLHHFINRMSGHVLPFKITGLCQTQHKKLLLEYEKAVDIGYIKTKLPFVLYNYREIYADRFSSEQLDQIHDYCLYEKVKKSFVDDLTENIELPPNIHQMLDKNIVVDHIQEFTAESADVVPEPPKLPNRYKMEENYKALLLKRKRSRSSIMF